MPILSSIVAGTVVGIAGMSAYAIATRRGRSRVEAAGLGAAAGLAAAGTGAATVGAYYAAGAVYNAGSSLVLLAAKGAAHAAGFGAGGVVAGSPAAGVQSIIGSVVKGSLFALLQSFGAKP